MINIYCLFYVLSFFLYFTFIIIITVCYYHFLDSYFEVGWNLDVNDSNIKCVSNKMLTSGN